MELIHIMRNRRSIRKYMPLVFVCLGYINGEYPHIKPRVEGRTLYITKKE